MKKLITTALLIVTGIFAKATDRVVQESGPIGTYNSINAAVTDAVDGDVIIINNKLSNLPWIEDVTINKSLTFVCAVDNQKFLVNGKYLIEKALNREVLIVGMENTGLGIEYSGSNTPVTRTKVTITNSLINGDVNFNSNEYEVKLYSNIILGALSYKYGDIVGNEIRNVFLYSDVTSNDTLYIVGNIIGNQSYGAGPAFTSQNNTQVLYISNNYFLNFGTSVIHWTVNFNWQPKAGSIIVNCTAKNFGSSTRQSLNNFDQLVINSVFVKGFNGTQNLSLWYYNASSVAVLPGGSQNNYSNSSVDINFNGTNNFTQGTDAGNPANEYLDLDLTRNDMGCYGGSYSLANFHPIIDGKSARVSFVKTPRVVNKGNTFRVDAIGFDK